MPSADTWINIASLVITSIVSLIAARLGAYWQARDMRANATPATNQPKQRIERIKAESHSRLKKLAAATLGSGVPLLSLIVAMSRPIMDRWSVLVIAVCVGWIMVQVAVSLSVYTIYKIWFSLKTAA